MRAVFLTSNQSIPRDRNDVFALTHEGFPKIDEMVEVVARSGISKVPLSREDIESILTTLVFDGKIEMLASGSYRALRTSSMTNGLTEAPCGVCPVRFLLSIGSFLT